MPIPPKKMKSPRLRISQLFFTLLVFGLLLFSLKIAQVAVLSERNTLYDKVNKVTVSDPEALAKWDAGKAEAVARDGGRKFTKNFIDYRKLSGFQIALTGFWEKADDLSVWHLVILGLILFFLRESLKSLPDGMKRRIDGGKLIKGRREWTLALLLMAASYALYFFHISQNSGEIHGTFFVTTDVLSIRLIQYAEGTIHLLTTLVAYSVFPFILRLIRECMAGLQAGDSFLPSATYLLNIGLCSVAVGSVGFVLVRFVLVDHIITKSGNPMFPVVEISEAILLTIIWTLPFLIASMIAFDRKPSSYKLDPKVFKLGMWIDMAPTRSAAR